MEAGWLSQSFQPPTSATKVDASRVPKVCTHGASYQLHELPHLTTQARADTLLLCLHTLPNHDKTNSRRRCRCRYPTS